MNAYSNYAIQSATPATDKEIVDHLFIDYAPVFLVSREGTRISGDIDTSDNLSRLAENLTNSGDRYSDSRTFLFAVNGSWRSATLSDLYRVYLA